MNGRLTEYHLQLASFNDTRRFWAEYYLDSPRPAEQQELDLMRKVLHQRLVSHLKQTELRRDPLFRAAPLEDQNSDVVRNQIVSALRAGKTVDDSDIEIGGVCLWIPAIRLDKENGAFHVQAFAGNLLAGPSSCTNFENPARLLGSALKEFSDSKEWGLRWPRVNVEVQPWAPLGNLSPKSCGVSFEKHGSGFLIGSDVFREARSRLMAAVSNALEPPEDGNVFLSMDAAFLSDRDLPYVRSFAGTAHFKDVPVYLAPSEDQTRGWPMRELIDRRAEAICGNRLPPELMTENAVFLAAARVPVSARKRIREQTIVLSPGTCEWNSDLCETLSLVSHGLLDGIKEPCELLHCYARCELTGNAQSPESFAKAFRISVPAPPPAFAVGGKLTALELLSSKANPQNPSASQGPTGSYYSRALERCRWETKVFMHAWQGMEKRAGILLRSKPDLERTVDGDSWKVLTSVKIDAALEASAPVMSDLFAVRLDRPRNRREVDARLTKMRG